MQTVRRAADGEAAPISRLLARAFHDDPLPRWYLDCRRYEAVVELEFLEAARQLIPDGSLWVAGALDGVAAWLPPGAHYDDEAIDAVVQPFLARHGGSPDRATAFWAWVETHRPDRRHWYLDFLGVEPDRQLAGCGSLLLRHGLERADRRDDAVFLITGSAWAVPWYERHGFETSAVEPAPGGGPEVWFMVRPPVN
jgi:ribosomal protein S18 acetylase RimI-like enzyme